MFEDQFEQFFILLCCLLLIAAANCCGGTVLKMISHQRPADSAKRLLNGSDLNDDIGTIAFLLNHFLEAANLTLNAAKTLHVRAFDIRIDRNSLAWRVIDRATARLVSRTVFRDDSLSGGTFSDCNHDFSIYPPPLLSSALRRAQPRLTDPRWRRV